MKEQLTHRERRLKDEWDISYILARKIDEAISNAEKYVRAEVLAACIDEFDQYLCSCSTNFVGKPKSDHEKSCPKYVVGVLRKLQPAASDLEALLRKSEIRGAMDELALIETERGHRGWFAFDLYEQTGARLKSLTEELVELEKARASLEKP